MKNIIDYIIKYKNEIPWLYDLYKNDLIHSNWKIYTQKSRSNGKFIYSIEHVINGVPHREDGPAKVVFFEEIFVVRWYLNGESHRENGPAVIHNGGEEWYINNKKINVSEWIIDNNFSSYTEWTDDIWVLFKLKFL